MTIKQNLPEASAMHLFINTTSPYARIARIALIEKKIDVQWTLVDPWQDDPALLAHNPAGRVPTLVLDDGMALTECLLIVQYLERCCPVPTLFGGNAAVVASQAGLAMGVIDAAVHTLIGRKSVGTAFDFDASPVGLRRRRSMENGLVKLESQAPAFHDGETPTLAAIAAVVAVDYVALRFPNAAWRPATPLLQQLRDRLDQRKSFAETRPCL